MGTNLQNPQKDIAEGELSALAVSFGLCSAFVLMLGAGVERFALLCDFMISERISLTKIFFISGLYISCLSSILSSTLGTSRVIQGIASEGLIQILNSFAEEEVIAFFFFLFLIKKITNLILALCFIRQKSTSRNNISHYCFSFISFFWKS